MWVYFYFNPIYRVLICSFFWGYILFETVDVLCGKKWIILPASLLPINIIGSEAPDESARHSKPPIYATHVLGACIKPALVSNKCFISFLPNGQASSPFWNGKLFKKYWWNPRQENTRNSSWTQGRVSLSLIIYDHRITNNLL